MPGTVSLIDSEIQIFKLSKMHINKYVKTFCKNVEGCRNDCAKKDCYPQIPLKKTLESMWFGELKGIHQSIFRI